MLIAPIEMNSTIYDTRAVSIFQALYVLLILKSIFEYKASYKKKNYFTFSTYFWKRNYVFYYSIAYVNSLCV